MPYNQQAGDRSHLLRALVIGPEKARKTWWTLRAAEAGFHVTLLDGDDGADIMETYFRGFTDQALQDKLRQRILRINLIDDTINGRGVFAPFISAFLTKGSTFTWDETAKEKAPLTGRDPVKSYIDVDARKLTSNDVVVIDSLTKLAFSSGLRFAEKNDINLFEGDKTDWDGYGFQGRFLTLVMQAIHSLPCHVIVVGHTTVYEKWDRRDKKNPVMLWQRTIPISSSGPHSLTIGKEFADILFFEVRAGNSVYINTGAAADRIGGCRHLPPALVEWEKLSLPYLLGVAGYPNGDFNLPCEGFAWRAPGYVPPEKPNPLTKLTLGTGKPSVLTPPAKPNITLPKKGA